MSAHTPMAVTYSGKRYITICIGCGGVFDAARSDQMVCGSKCRVRAHRSGEMKRRRELAAMPAINVPPALIGHIEAGKALLPGYENRIMAGESAAALMPEVAVVYDEMLAAFRRKNGGGA